MEKEMEIAKLVEKNGKGDFQLAGQDGNAFAIMGRVQRGLRKARWPREDVDQVMREMTSGDYNHLLTVAASVQGSHDF